MNGNAVVAGAGFECGKILVQLSQYTGFYLRSLFAKLFPFGKLACCAVAFFPDEPQSLVVPVDTRFVAVESFRQGIVPRYFLLDMAIVASVQNFGYVDHFYRTSLPFQYSLQVHQTRHIRTGNVSGAVAYMIVYPVFPHFYRNRFF